MSKSKLSLLDSLSFQEFQDDAEFIPLMSSEDEEEMNNEDLPEILPILPLRNTVLFPGVIVPITAGRDKSIALIHETNKEGKIIGVVSQKEEGEEDPGIDDINTIGTVAKILKVLKMPDGNTTVIIQGKKRFQVSEVITTEPYITATVRAVEEARPAIDNAEFLVIVETIKEKSLAIIKDSPNIPSDASFAIKNIESPSFLINFVSSNLNISVSEKQALLQINDLQERALETLRYMNLELQKLSLRNDIQSKVHTDINKQQREYFLNQQMKTIQEELGGSSSEAEIEEMRARGKAKKWNDDTAAHFKNELTKMQRLNPQVAEYSIQKNYLDLLLELPWNEFSKDKFDLKRAKKILDRDHYGLDDVKKRIIEFLAVLKLRNDMKSPILCLYGPPGVGKTSLGKSVAEALGREYIRISLGGLRDEAEIRGHRKTYIGAMPGRIIKSLKKAGTSNPVFVLDEIDKLSIGNQGDPSSALLEVLDPEQNNSFYDNFLELGYDLSKVMFIATSNSLSTIQPALRDRMEIINVTGYTIEEKVEIAKQHLFPKQLKEHGLSRAHLKVGKPQLEKIVEGYTRESGVRGLEKQIAKTVRYAAMKIAMEETYEVKVSNDAIIDILGVPRLERDKYENNQVAGVVTGLAWTRVGGDILFIESTISKGKGTLNMTGNLGKVMKESATIAMEYIKSNAEKLGLKQDIFEKYNVHIHVPEGATPKDGPSAGITMLTSLVSLFTQRKVKKSLAMTGEITLRGKVLPVGGIKEKILAAKRARIKEILLCEENKRDIDEINPAYLKGLTFHYVKEMSDVLALALTKEKVKGAKKL
jgi:ATP-dependent Lon protease